MPPDEWELHSLLASHVRALYLVDYLSLPQDARRCRRWCDDRGLMLIEDAAQAWLASLGGHPVGTFGDLVPTYEAVRSVVTSRPTPRPGIPKVGLPLGHSLIR